MQLALFSLQRLLFEVINKLWYVVLINRYIRLVSLGDSFNVGLFQGSTRGTVGIFTGG